LKSTKFLAFRILAQLSSVCVVGYFSHTDDKIGGTGESQALTQANLNLTSADMRDSKGKRKVLTWLVIVAGPAIYLVKLHVTKQSQNSVLFLVGVGRLEVTSEAGGKAGRMNL
jgi:hypothetical protein